MKSSRVIQVEIDEVTARRLDTLASVCEKRRENIAASLLHDVLKDDELFNDEPHVGGNVIYLN